MAPILSPRETSFLFPLLEESSFSWVISKELCLKASHPGAAVWTCSGFTSSTEVVSHKFISWDLWAIGVEILLTIYSEGDLWIYFSYKLKRMTIWAGCSRDKRDLTLSRTRHQYGEQRCHPPLWGRHSLQSPGPESSKAHKGFLGISGGGDICSRGTSVRHEMSVCEVTLTFSEWI